jgi:hypothetical protein
MQVNEYLEMKQRMLLAAELLRLVVTQDDTIRFDEETFPLIQHAGLSNKEDLQKLFAELDILRARLGEPLLPVTEEKQHDAERDTGDGSVRDDDGADVPRNETPPEGVEEDVAAKPTKPRRRRSNNTGNKRSRKKNTKRVESSD